MTHIHPIYDDEKRFVIDAVTKTISIPEADSPVLIQHDHNSEHITFECDRFVEGHDLMLCNKVEVHYNNIRDSRRSVKGVYPVEDFRISDKDNSKIVFTWVVSLNATTYNGPLWFAVKFSCTDEVGDILYRWNTNICKDLTVSEGIDNGEAVEENYADVLEAWRLELFGIEDTAEANMKRIAQQQCDAMEVKAKEVIATIPDEYMDYSEFETSKADVTDINRLFDSDWVTGNLENLYPHGDSSFTYDGESLYKGVAAGDNFYLEEGQYNLIIADTNAIGIYVMLSGTDTRLVQIKENHVGIHNLDITSEYANQPLVLMYYASAATANEAGDYYLKRPYIFKRTDRGILAEDFFIRTPAKLLESDLVRSQKGDNLYTGGDIKFYYDGAQTYIGVPSLRFSLEEGSYTLTILDTNAIYFVLYIGDPSDTAGRIFATNEVPNSYKFDITSENANIPLTLFINASLDTVGIAGDYYANSIYIFKDDGVPFLPDYLVGNVGSKISGPAYKAQNGCLSIASDTLSAGEILSIDAVCDVKKNKSLVFTAKFDTFTGLRLGHGRTSYGGSYIELYTTNLGVYQYTTAVTNSSLNEHGLTFSDFVTVVINVGVNFANITVFTSTGSFTVNNVDWSGCNGEIFAEAIDTEFTDCELKWTSADVKERVWVFGDSYLGFDDNRWAGQMHNLGYKNWLACGFPGGQSASELASFKTLLTLGIPDTVIWCMGMNNGDSGAINSSWLYNVEEMIKLCRDNNITLILATIPTCPAVDNTYKNDWVRNSGYRYVDFDKAVGVNGTSWYDGMMAGDNIHPTELGAKALASRVCIDVPEIMQGGYRMQLDKYYP